LFSFISKLTCHWTICCEVFKPCIHEKFKVMQMKKARDIIREIEEELNGEIIEALKSLNRCIAELNA
jgi:hypothetical protein